MTCKDDYAWNITQLKLQNKKGDITPQHIRPMSMWRRAISPSFYFCSFICVIFICKVGLNVAVNF